ncbi:MAG TPA: DinB family protein [Bryobacteraceae bacterium]|nr:DinB family protein [Bryobacteraceae bacterium]
MYRILTLTALVVSLAAAQEGQSANPLSNDVRSMWKQVQGNVLKSAEKMPEEHFNFKPVDSVRTFGALLGHVADANYSICGMAKAEKPPVSGIEKSKTARGDVIDALKASFAYCDTAYSALTDKTAVESVKWFRGERTRAAALMGNTMHDIEHYGNMVTYMRMKGIVPPSSEPRQ